MNISIKSLKRQQIIFGAIALLLAVLAFLAPFQQVSVPEHVGGCLIWTAVLVFIQGFRRASIEDRKSANQSAVITLFIGALFINAKYLQGAAVLWAAAILFGLNAAIQATRALKNKKAGKDFYRPIIGAIANVLVFFGILLFSGRGLEWIISVAGGLRIIGMMIEIITAKLGIPEEISEDVLRALDLPEHSELHAIAKRIDTEENQRAPIDRGWIFSFIVILFFMHLGRMGFDRSGTGLLSPMVALIGDLVIALIIAFLIIKPLRAGFRGVTRPIERATWNWVLSTPVESRKWYSLKNLVQWWLESRLRISIRIRKSGYSLPTAIRAGLQTGLPFAALLAAIIPVFGMSWYFDTENWAAGIWDGWAAARTDTWRKAMVDAVAPNPTGSDFMLKPAGISDTADFSFVVIGDPGEGDASQMILHDQIVRVSEKPDVKFVVISSDVVYPDGAMKDYEKNFWLPMMGVRKPVYAIPGNHDWYDALDGFAATFFEPAIAKKTMRARREADLKLTATTEEKIEDLVSEAARLRKEYQVPTGYQQAPFFQVQTKDFAFITIETGVLRRIDDAQMEWLKNTLEAAKGKFIFVLLGHPFYAIGEYQGSMNPDFEALHELLRQHHVQVVMAGDTHDLEYYQEPLKGNDTGQVMHHFVNGGGGAYLSIGAALKPKNEMPEKVWAHYPATAPLVQKIEDNTGWLKAPAWKWTKNYNGWPFSAEWLSAAFDYNVAPFYQSFMEIKVEHSKRQVRLLGYTAQGPLTWQQLEASSGVKPADAKPTDQVEWIFKMSK